VPEEEEEEEEEEDEEEEEETFMAINLKYKAIICCIVQILCVIYT